VIWKPILHKNEARNGDRRMALPYDPVVKIRGKHARDLAKQLKNPKPDKKRIQTSSDARKIFQKHNHD
jgi:hypothetical protein